MRDVRFKIRDIFLKRFYFVQALFWDRNFRISEIRYFDSDGEIRAIKREDLSRVRLLRSTGIAETRPESGNPFIFEGDIVEIEYQRGNSTCVVEWCEIKNSLVLRPVRGNKPKNQRHFRISGKKSLKIIGNIFDSADFL